MTVTVYVWRFRKRGLVRWGNVGHTSIKVSYFDRPEYDFYLSWWPGGDDLFGFGRTTSHINRPSYDKKSETERVHAIHNGKDEDGNWLVPRDKLVERLSMNTSDKTEEGRSADAKYIFNLGRNENLDQDEMFASFRMIHQGAHSLSAKGHAKAGEYNLIHQNCSDAVAWLLDEGGAGKLVPKPKMRFFWTPTDVAKWCDRLVLKANEAQPGSAQRSRGFTNNNLDFTQLGGKFSALA